jgi:hypothetical protein
MVAALNNSAYLVNASGSAYLVYEAVFAGNPTRPKSYAALFNGSGLPNPPKGPF